MEPKCFRVSLSCNVKKSMAENLFSLIDIISKFLSKIIIKNTELCDHLGRLHQGWYTETLKRAISETLLRWYQRLSICKHLCRASLLLEGSKIFIIERGSSCCFILLFPCLVFNVFPWLLLTFAIFQASLASLLQHILMKGMGIGSSGWGCSPFQDIHTTLPHIFSAVVFPQDAKCDLSRTPPVY